MRSPTTEVVLPPGALPPGRLPPIVIPKVPRVEYRHRLRMSTSERYGSVGSRHEAWVTLHNRRGRLLEWSEAAPAPVSFTPGRDQEQAGEDTPLEDPVQDRAPD